MKNEEGSQGDQDGLSAIRENQENEVSQKPELTVLGEKGSTAKRLTSQLRTERTHGLGNTEGKDSFGLRCYYYLSIISESPA